MPGKKVTLYLLLNRNAEPITQNGGSQRKGPWRKGVSVDVAGAIPRSFRKALTAILSACARSSRVEKPR